jgi:hypothetical protein
VKISRRLFAAAVAAVLILGYVYATAVRGITPIRSDGFSYYVYLPSWFIYHDASLSSVAKDCCGGQFPPWTAIIRWPATGRWVDAHPIGEALLLAPAFLVAHLLTRWTNLAADGFTVYYQHAAGLSGLFAAVAGLLLLRRVLLRYFTEGVTTATLASLLAGTSLYHYATFDSVWSHAFSFALIAALLERVTTWRRDRTGDGVLVGAIAGLIVLVRHTNAIIPAMLIAAAAMLRRRERNGPDMRAALIAVAVASLVIVPQLLVYRAATGHIIVSSYGDLRFAFTSPHLVGVLVSPAKGLFFWSPLLLFAVVGFFVFPEPLRRWRPAIVSVLVLDTYLIASWWDWQFGASYGHRGFVDLYPFFALGLASFYERVSQSLRSRRAAIAVVVTLCALSTFQMLQYWHGVLPMSDTTWSQYRSAFLRPWW